MINLCVSLSATAAENTRFAEPGRFTTGKKPAEQSTASDKLLMEKQNEEYYFSYVV